MPSLRNESYPLIVFPNYYEEIRNKEPNFSDLFPDTPCPVKPQKLTVSEYTKEAESKKKNKFDNPFTIIAIIVFTFIIYCCTAIIIHYGLKLFLDDNLALSISQIAPIPIGIIVFIVIAIRKNKNKLTDDEIKKSIDNYYRYEVMEYEKRIKPYNRNLQKFNDLEFINNYKNNLLKEAYLEVKNNILHSSKIITNPPKKGITEDYFYDYLISRPEFEVYQSLKFNYYYPDIALLHKETNICIDIEIDEPYSFEEKKPIHFDGTDTKRDSYFSENGFLVIRFTEDQIINHTYLCYTIIKKCITALTDFISAGTFKDKNVECQKIKTKAWTYDEAFNMAGMDTRKDVNNIIEKNKNSLKEIINKQEAAGMMANTDMSPFEI